MTTDRHRISGRRLGHVAGLDGVRALAALVVVGFHAQLAGFGNGDIGVDVFFVLSGFLITSILLVKARPGSGFDYRDFYRRRALRLLPAYFAVVIACVAVELVVNYGGTLKGAVVSSLYMANWLVGATGTGLGTLSHTWSLSIEEQFYLVWPALLLLLLRRGHWNGRTVLLSVAGLVALAWLLVVGLALAGAPARVASNATPARAVELLFGGLLAVYVATPTLSGSMERVRAASGVSLAGVTAGVLLLALVPITGTSESVDSIVGWPLISVLTCIVIYACLRDAAPLRSALGNRLMTGIGKRSYGLYLWHFPVFVIIDTEWGIDGWPERIAGLVITTVLVLASYRFIEQPFLARKDTPRPEPAVRSGTSASAPVAVKA